jgi:hypothetical protein
MYCIPNKVKIGIYTYDVEIAHEPLMLNRQECKAIIDYENLVISISSQITPQHQFQSLWHELLHGVVKEHQVNLGDEEDIVDGIAVGIVQLMQDNPNLFIGGENIE